MDFFKKSRDRVLQTIGLADKPPKDAELARRYDQLQKLDSMVTALQATVEGYARSMLAVGDATRVLAADVGKFYRKSEERQKSIQQFLTAMADQESNLLFLYKEQFGWDVQRELDLWRESLRVLRERLRAADEQSVGVETLKARVDAMRAAGRGKGEEFEREDSKLRHNAKQLATLMGSVGTDVDAAIANRFSRFDQVRFPLLRKTRDVFGISFLLAKI